MSDLVRGNLPTARAENGSGPAPMATDPPRGVRTPTDVMRERRAREARRRAAQEARQQDPEEGGTRTRPAENVAGVANTQTSQRRPIVPDSGYGQETSSVPIEQAAPKPSRVREGTQIPAGQDTRRQPDPRPARTDPSRRPPEDRYQMGGDQRGENNPEMASRTQRNRTEALDTLNIPAGTTVPSTSTQIPTSQPLQQPVVERSRPGFPHAFERWETLSSHWEGLTSYWIRRLQENTNELSGRPIDQQMSRQITDLSAAGANLFHAVVELQRLRASSERKFQRWFFETRNEQERAREIQAELERQLREEREARTRSTTSIDAVQAEKTKAEELVREMRREIQVSKEEARRAWEELGRREQEERERTAALRSGEPTTIGGVQVVPMAHGPSRQTSAAQRPQTRDDPGTYEGGPRMVGGQPQAPSRSHTTTTLDSPDDEQRQFTYQRADESPTNTDPFVETRRANDAAQTPSRGPTQPPSSNAAIAAARAATNSISTPSHAYADPPSSGPGSSTPRFYQQAATDTAIPITAAGHAATLLPPPRTGTAGTDRSYLASTASGSLGEEEYEINPDGTYTRDTHGRRIPYGTSGTAAHPDDDNEYEVQAEIARERALAQRYGQQSQSQSQNTPRTAGLAVPAPLVPSSARAGTGTGATHAQSAYAQVTVPPAAPSPELGEQDAEPGDVDHEGAGYGGSDATWSGLPTGTSRHRHQTPLSAILEERSGRTSPSRTSYASGGGGGGQGGGQHGGGSGR